MARRKTGFLALAIGMLLGAVAGTWFALDARRSGPGTAEPMLADLPARLAIPTSPVDLPADRKVGRAALLFHRIMPLTAQPSTTLERQDVFLVTTAGEAYRVGRTGAETFSFDASLSPDGRWLGRRLDGGGWRLRDLTGTRELAVPDGYWLLLWSHDSGSALLAHEVDGRFGYAVMELPDGGVHRYQLADPLEGPVALIEGRVVAVEQPREPTNGLSVKIQELDSGTTWLREVIGPAALGSGESLGSVTYVGGSPPSLWTGVRTAESDPRALFGTALVGADFATGRTLGRIPFAPTRSGEVELPAGVVPDGVVVTRWVGDRTELILADPATGDRRVITEFPGTLRIQIPGGVF